jgi:hypothetical protein
VQQLKIMASKRRARKLFLHENCALKYDLCGYSRQSKHEIYRTLLQVGEFHHLYIQLRADSNKFFEYCRMLPATLTEFKHINMWKKFTLASGSLTLPRRARRSHCRIPVAHGRVNASSNPCLKQKYGFFALCWDN